MKAVRRLGASLFVIASVLLTPIVAQATPVDTVSLPPGGPWAVTATVLQKNAANQLEFGLWTPPAVEGPGTFDPTCGGVETDCAPGDTHTYTGQSGDLTFYLIDHTTNCDQAVFFSGDASSSHIDAVDGNPVHWTIRWDDGGSLDSGDPPSCLRDGDFDDLVVDIRSGADLSVTKSDDGVGFGPDPVSSGQTIKYDVVASNAGPNDATNVIVADTITSAEGTVQSATTSVGSCAAPSGGSVQCSRSSLASGADWHITVTVLAPTNTGTTPKTVTDAATVSSDTPDPDGSNDAASENTAVNPVSSGTAQDSASGFYDGVHTLDIQTVFGASGDSVRSEVIVPPSAGGTNGYQPSTVTDQEKSAKLAQYIRFCGGSQCDQQVDVTVLPPGTQAGTTAFPGQPIKVILYYKDDAIAGDAVYALGDDDTTPILLRPCDASNRATVAGVVKKCIASNTTGGRPKVKTIVVLVPSGNDPTVGKR
jgi:uncharacterized repeat protein (TIGR01451 family)